MVDNLKITREKLNRRTLGVHLTSTDIFRVYIFPEIKQNLKNYIWVDLFAGEGNLILPILEAIPVNERTNFFRDHMYLFDVQFEMVKKCIDNAEKYAIPRNIAEQNIMQRDNLTDFPTFLLKKNLPVFHITNPPYLYLGYIRKHKETSSHLKYFENENDGYQDLYQIAMINDLRNGVENLIYIIPSNFLFGAAVSNKFRIDFLKYYNISKMYIFETKVFEHTGTNICIAFLYRKAFPKSDKIEFIGTKIRKKEDTVNIAYKLKPEFKYRGGAEFDEFVNHYRMAEPIVVKYYLLKQDVEKNKGINIIRTIDASNYVSNDYLRVDLRINDFLKNKIESNILYTKTVDTGSSEGRVGLYEIEKDFEVKGVYVSKNTYRTSPIQVFFEPVLSIEDQLLLKDYFNLILEYFRKELDSEFLTTYKYSNAEYTRKYLGLTQVRSLIQTCPLIGLNEDSRIQLGELISKKRFDELQGFISFFSKYKKNKAGNLE